MHAIPPTTNYFAGTLQKGLDLLVKGLFFAKAENALTGWLADYDIKTKLARWRLVGKATAGKAIDALGQPDAPAPYSKIKFKLSASGNSPRPEIVFGGVNSSYIELQGHIFDYIVQLGPVNNGGPTIDYARAQAIMKAHKSNDIKDNSDSELFREYVLPARQWSEVMLEWRRLAMQDGSYLTNGHSEGKSRGYAQPPGFAGSHATAEFPTGEQQWEAY